MSHLRSLARNLTDSLSIERALAACAMLLGALMAWRVYDNGLVKALTDQNSHLDFARLTFDSMTPGVSQLGFWPPLLHVLLMPFVAVRPLYDSGLAGAIVLVPCLMLCTILLYRIILRLTGKPLLGVAGAGLFLMNPYVLYYAATPMMEILFIAMVFLSTYLLLRWIETDDLLYLMGTGVAVSLACLSRFEGFLFIPVTGMIVLLRLLRHRTRYEQVEALLILFGLLAAVGACAIFMYSWVYGSSPFAFASGEWLRDPAVSSRSARYNLAMTLLSTMSASVYMLGLPLVLLSGIGLLLLLLLNQQLFKRLSVLCMLATPLLFVLLTMYLGLITINVPELPPYDIFHNDRYSLTWIGFAIVIPLLLLHELDTRLHADAWWASVARLIGVALLVDLLTFSGVQLYSIAVARDFDVIRQNINSPLPEQIEIARHLRERYDGGKILAARVDNDPIFATAGIPLRQYLYEGNYRYFDQAIQEPWFFATWVLMHVPDEDGWAEQHEPVYTAVGTSEEFLKYYDLANENGKRKLYRLNDNHLLQLVKERGYDPGQIPSLNADIDTWEPSTIYTLMRAPAPARMPPERLVRSKATIRSQLLEFYWTHLKPKFEQHGYVTDEVGGGNSESQSYAMIQSLQVDDVETFELVWRWTKDTLQREDGLFAWKFRVAGDGTVTIEDANSATDADVDIAAALLRAGKRWRNDAYIADAMPILDGIWQYETIERDGKRHLTAGNWTTQNGPIVINPSYFSPSSYRLFAQHDLSHDWLSLIDVGYDDLHEASEMARTQHGKYLPPDWAQINPDTGVIEPFSQKIDSMAYSFDAFRTLWRVAEDARLYREPRAKEYLTSIDAFDEEWEKNNRLCTLYLGESQADEPCHIDMGTLAGAVSVWKTLDPARAEDILRTFALSAGRAQLPEEVAFYEQSWYWFMLWQWSESGSAERR